MKKESKIKLENAEIFYKYALAVSSPLNTAKLQYLETFSYLKHVATKKDLELSKSEENIGAIILERVGMYMMILALNEVMDDEWGKKRFQSKDSDIYNIAHVVRLIRNAFAHDPFKPKWDIPDYLQNKELIIPGVLVIKTSSLHDKIINRRDYGGPIALLCLLQLMKQKL